MPQFWYTVSVPLALFAISGRSSIWGRQRRSVESEDKQSSEMTGIFLCPGSYSRYLSVEKHSRIFRSCLTVYPKANSGLESLCTRVEGHVSRVPGSFLMQTHTCSCYVHMFVKFPLPWGSLPAEFSSKLLLPATREILWHGRGVVSWWVALPSLYCEDSPNH